MSGHAVAREAKEAMGYDSEPALEVCGTCRHAEQRASRKLWCGHPGAPAPFRVKWSGTCWQWKERA